MSKQFSVEVGCKKIPNSKKLVCNDGIKRTQEEYKALKKDKKVKNKLPSKGTGKEKGKGKSTFTPRPNSFMPRYPIAKATRKELTEDEVLRARGIQGSKIFHKKGMEALKKHLKEHLKGYKIEKAIDEGILLSKGDKGRLFFRGTNPTKVKDIMTDLGIVTGNVSKTAHYKRLKKLAQEALEKYGKNLDMSGYSLGGAMSYSLGQDLDIPSLSLNPLIASNVVSDLSPQNIVKNVAREFSGGYGAGIDSRGFKINAKHRIIRTIDDPVSLLLAYSKLPSNARIDTINGDVTSLSPLDWHYLKNFYKKKHENVDFRDKTDVEMRAAMKKQEILGNKFGEYIMLQRMKDDIKKGMTLKEHMSMEDRGDLTSLGKFGDRAVKRYYELWRKAGGKVSSLEAAEIRSRGGKIRRSNIDPSLDSKTKAFETSYTRESLARDIRENSARMRNLKEKNAFVKPENEQKMLDKVSSSKEIELKKLRSQYDKRIKDLNSKAILKRGERQFPSPDEIKKNILRQKMEKGRAKLRLKRQKARKRQDKMKEKQEQRAAKKAAKEAEKKLTRERLRYKFRKRLKKGLSPEAEDRQIAGLQRREARKGPDKSLRTTDYESWKKLFGGSEFEKQLSEGQKFRNKRKSLDGEQYREADSDLFNDLEEKTSEDIEETKDEEATTGNYKRPANRDSGESAPFQKQPTNIESSARDVLTSDTEASAFLNKSKAERLKQIAEFQKKQEDLIKQQDSKVAVPREGPSFKRAIQDELRGNLKLLPASIVASYGTGLLFQALDPDDKFTDTAGGQTLEGGVSGLGTAGVMSALGMDVGGALGLAEFGVGGALGQVASNAVGSATYSALRNDGMGTVGASTLSGAASGATFAGVAGASALVTRKAGSAIAKALATEEESEEGIELTGDSAEIATEGVTEGEILLEGGELGGEIGESLGPLGALAGVIVGAGLGALFGALDPPKSPAMKPNAKPLSYAELREELGEKTGIWGENTIQLSNKKKFSVNNFKIDQDQLALNAGETPINKPVYDNTPVQGGSGPV